ncbi:helix-turn-helix domain-containing protein [Enterococcus casseliflavus]|uniref:helix-turn-helix domain-containing protein n=1 Tax=Enterococcus casseliflavus TaxID=37734 RepID=UPI001432B089|nr:helix-turn-helix domain-containing protein [Enterococcus casseliflavus]NKD34140.1 helix-turn-helix domain-containing protein [Enterococcus casseliflavus]
MEELTLYTHCLFLYDLFSIPIRIKNNNLNHTIPTDWRDFEPSQLQKLAPKGPSYFVNENYFYYGIIPIPELDTTLCFGPVFESAISRNEKDKIIEKQQWSSDVALKLTDMFNQIPHYSFSYFLYFLSYTHFLLNHEQVDIRDIQEMEPQKKIPLDQLLVDNSILAKEEQNFHNTYHFEKLYLGCVEKGDINRFRRIRQELLALKPGTLSTNSLRHTKNLFITSISLVTRAAIKGGLDLETAYLLSDISIRKMETFTSYEAINTFQQQTIETFIERVAQQRIPTHVSPIIAQSLRYIADHLNTPFTVQQLAEILAVNRSYLSRLFKQETGENLSHYILDQKLAEAKELLAFSGMSINEISSYLHFSSQSHFQNTFKKKYGTSPARYRKSL